MKKSIVLLVFVLFTLPNNGKTTSFDNKMNTQKTEGIHIIAEFWGADVIEDTLKLEKLLAAAAQEAQYIPTQAITKKVAQQDVTTMILLTKSNTSIHAWLERDYIAIDIFTCENNTSPLKAINYLQEILQPKKVHIQELLQGKRSIPPTEITKKEDTLFGQELAIDLKNCNHETICSEEKIKEYIDQLCLLIDMKKYGKPFIERFATHSTIAAGYSFAQMIETSLISGHLSEHLNNAYINIFSCKLFDVNLAAEFTKQFFGANSMNLYNTFR